MIMFKSNLRRMSQCHVVILRMLLMALVLQSVESASPPSMRPTEVIRGVSSGWLQQSAPSVQCTTCQQPSAAPVTPEHPSTMPSAKKLSPAVTSTTFDSASSCLLARPQASCFVSTFPMWKTKHTPTLATSFGLNDRVPSYQTTQQHMPRGTLLMGVGGPDDDEMLTNETNNLNPTPPVRISKDQRLIPFLMYTVVAFLPPVVLTTLNDDYQFTKSQFNYASAALTQPLADLAKDSAEYTNLSSMYNDTMGKLFVVLLSKRLALYFLATCATIYAGWRASMAVVSIRDDNGGYTGPGDALDKLNKEIFQDEDDDSSDEIEEEKGRDDDQLFATLIDDSDQSSNAGTILAVALPLVLAGSLAFSYLGVVAKSSISAETSMVELPDELLSSLPYLSSLPSALLCLLFAATEFRWALPTDSPDDQDAKQSTTNKPQLLCAGNILALLYVAGAYVAKVYPTITLNGFYLDLWPLQNGVNIALATAVTRGLAPFLFPTLTSAVGNKSIRTIALATLGITMFDAISVFGTVANAATTDMVSADPSMSVMETVARAKLASPSSDASPLAYLWQPGLLEIILGHDSSKVSEALGLGDIVFPSILIAWGFAADYDANSSTKDVVDSGESESGEEKSNGYPYASAAAVGYLLGSTLTEITGSFSLLGNLSGLPALVFLVPSMLFTITIVAWWRNEIDEVWGGAAGG